LRCDITTTEMFASTKTTSKFHVVLPCPMELFTLFTLSLTYSRWTVHTTSR